MTDKVECSLEQVRFLIKTKDDRQGVVHIENTKLSPGQDSRRLQNKNSSSKSMSVFKMRTSMNS